MTEAALSVAEKAESPVPERLGRLPEHLRAAEQLLRDWGWWARTQANRAPNAPSGETLNYRLIREGPWAAGQCGQKPEGQNRRMLIADALVSQLAPDERREVVHTVYMDAPHRGWNQDIQAKVLHLSISTLKMELTVIREIIRERLEFLTEIEKMDIS